MTSQNASASLLKSERTVIILAAKAAGVCGRWIEPSEAEPELKSGWMICPETCLGCRVSPSLAETCMGNTNAFWDPLHNDAIIARLEAQFRLNVVWYPGKVSVRDVICRFDTFNNDPQKARARATLMSLANIANRNGLTADRPYWPELNRDDGTDLE